MKFKNGVFIKTWKEEGKPVYWEFTPLSTGVIMAIGFALFLCGGLFVNKLQRERDRTRPIPITVIKVIYQNGDVETITINAYPDDIYLASNWGTMLLKYHYPGDQVISQTAATDVRRFELISSKAISNHD